jgi:superfamily II DNA/RNA helicase
LEHAPAVLIGTPGRLLDHIEKENVDVSSARTLVLDEFDKSLELGFTDEMRDIIANLPSVRRRVLTSATESVEIPYFTGVRNPVRLSFLKDAKESDRLRLRTVGSPIKDKLETLYRLLGELNGESALVFCNFRETVERVSDYLTSKGVANEYFHGGMEQPDRERALSLFRNGTATVFVSTDLASRGLDIPEVKNVIHYHLPINEEAYIHRNGRTARMKASGTAYMILGPEEELPEYVTKDAEEFYLPEEAKEPKPSEWVTVTINKGKRDKLSKKDVVGFLIQKGGLEKDELGVVEIKESCAYAAVKRNKKSSLLKNVREEKIKNMKAKFS